MPHIIKHQPITYDCFNAYIVIANNFWQTTVSSELGTILVYDVKCSQCTVMWKKALESTAQLLASSQTTICHSSSSMTNTIEHKPTAYYTSFISQIKDLKTHARLISPTKESEQIYKWLESSSHKIFRKIHHTEWGRPGHTGNWFELSHHWCFSGDVFHKYLIMNM